MAPTYEFLNRFAQARRSAKIGSPAIIWHWAYWVPPKSDDKLWQNAIKKYAEALKKEVALYVIAKGGDKNKIKSDFTELSFQENENPIGLKHSQYIIFYLRNVEFRIELDSYDEFISVKFILDFSYSSTEFSKPNNLATLRQSVGTLDQMLADRFCCSIHQKWTIDWRANLDTHKKSVEEISESISTSIISLKNDIFNGVSSEDLLGEDSNIFANFMGFSFGLAAGWLDDAERGTFARTKIGEIRKYIRSTARFGSKRDECPVECAVEAAWPMVTSLNPYVKIDTDKSESSDSSVLSNREFTISLINNGRSIYATSLGGKRPDGDKYFPLSYIIVSPHRSRWQIGSVIDHIHTLGVLRLATLIEYNEIERANEDMRKLIEELNDIDVEIQRYEVQRIGKRLNDINKTSKFGNGLHYRMEWSRYYANQFVNLIDMIDFESVEGYRDYKRFVMRKMSERFGTIETANRRYQYLSKLISEKFGLQTAITTRDLLKFGELVSIFPIGYYNFDVIQHLAETNGVFGLNIVNIYLLQWMGLRFDTTYWRVIWIVVFCIYVAVIFIEPLKLWLAERLNAYFELQHRLVRRKPVHRPSIINVDAENKQAPQQLPQQLDM